MLATDRNIAWSGPSCPADALVAAASAVIWPLRSWSIAAAKNNRGICGIGSALKVRWVTPSIPGGSYIGSGAHIIVGRSRKPPDSDSPIRYSARYASACIRRVVLLHHHAIAEVQRVVALNEIERYAASAGLREDGNERSIRADLQFIDLSLAAGIDVASHPIKRAVISLEGERSLQIIENGWRRFERVGESRPALNISLDAGKDVLRSGNEAWIGISSIPVSDEWQGTGS